MQTPAFGVVGIHFNPYTPIFVSNAVYLFGAQRLVKIPDEEINPMFAPDKANVAYRSLGLRF